MGGRLFQGFQQHVGGRGEHVHFIYDVYLVAGGFTRPKISPVNDCFAHVVNAGVRHGVNLIRSSKRFLIDRTANTALVTRAFCRRGLAD